MCIFSLLHGLTYSPTLIRHSKVKTIWHFGRIFSKNLGGIVGSWQQLPLEWLILTCKCKENFVWNYVVDIYSMKEHSHFNTPAFLWDFLFSIFIIQKIHVLHTTMQSLKNASSKNILPHSVIYVNIRSTNVQQVSMVVMNNIVFNICGAEIYCV